MPPTPRRLTEAGARRRQSLVTAAVDLIARKGPASVRVADVARAAGVPNSLVYWYFRDFDDLVAQAIADARKEVRAGVAARMEAHQDLLAQLVVMVRESLLLVAREPSLRVLLASEAGAPPGSPWVAELHKTATVFMNDSVLLLADGQVQGVVRQDVPAKYLAFCARSLVHESIIAWVNGLMDVELDAMADQVTAFVLRGFCASIEDAERAFAAVVKADAA